MTASELMLRLFERFVWMDEELQQRIRARGWPEISRSQSMVLLNISAGITRPADIARRLGVTRQAVHATINQLAELGIVRLEPDPADGRHRQVALTHTGVRMRDDAQHAIDTITLGVVESVGEPGFAQMMAALGTEWQAGPGKR